MVAGKDGAAIASQGDLCPPWRAKAGSGAVMFAQDDREKGQGGVEAVVWRGHREANHEAPGPSSTGGQGQFEAHKLRLREYVVDVATTTTFLKTP